MVLLSRAHAVSESNMDIQYMDQLSPSFSVVSQVRQGRSPAEAGVSRWSEMAPVSLVVQPAASNPFIQLATHQSIIEYLVLLLSTYINMY